MVAEIYWFMVSKLGGYGLVVERDLPKVETGVRFSLPAQSG